MSDGANKLNSLKKERKAAAQELATLIYDIFNGENAGAKIINGQINANQSAKD